MSTIVHSASAGRKKLHMAVGLRWVVLDLNGKSRKTGRVPAKVIRTQAATLAASKYVMIQSGSDRAAGFYNDPVVQAPPRADKIYSLSMLMLNEFMQQAPDAVVNAVVLMHAVRNSDKRALVIILSSQVTLDTLLDADKAIARVQDEVRNVPGISVFCESPEIGSDHTLITWDDITALTGAHGASSRLQAIPASPYLAPILLASILAVGALVGYDQTVRKPEAKKRAQIEAMKADRNPAYLAAVDLALQASGWDLADLHAMFDSLNQYPIFTKGWALESLACDGADCLSSWGRKGGTVDNLQLALPAEKLVIQAGDGATLTKGAVATLDRAYTVHARPAKFQVRSRDKLQTKEQSQLALYNPFQKLSNAGISATIGESTRWDGFDATGIDATSVMVQIPISITAPFFRTTEVLSLLPNNVSLKSFLLTSADGVMTINLKGFVYARQ
jgi:hypothetical protein